MVSNLHTKTLVTSDGRKYTYDTVPAKENKSTVLLIHGFPATRYDWKYQVEDLSSAGYGIIAIDCLGYGDSDKPIELEAYKLKNLAQHIIEILDKEGLDKVVGAGHDWGCGVLSRTAVWHPDRFEKLVFFSVPYTPPGILMDIDSINANSLKLSGKMPFGYWYFFNSHDAPILAAAHLESFFNLVFATENHKWIDNLGALGSARAWLENDTKTQLPAYMTEEDRAVWLAAFSKPNATTASMNYYKGLLRGINAEDEENLTDEDRTLRVPVLTMGGIQDTIAREDHQRMGTEPFAAAGYTHKTVNGGHWLIYEDREGIKDALLEFLGE
ncbi:epoxide hydrolase 2 [Fusarium longipes]|uniref:Epoxide hydrolase 2 n=1 Tax=Fusarium longipes TaxID=694270 RepID=A0A395T391_9HYPO|nr:epoxide hydrolase 2 [Fusarium longipes]